MDKDNLKKIGNIVVIIIPTILTSIGAYNDYLKTKIQAMESTSLIILMLGMNMSLTLAVFFYLKSKIDKQNKFNQQLANAINNHFYHINLIKQNYQHKESKVVMESKDGEIKQLQGEADLFYIDESDIPR